WPAVILQPVDDEIVLAAGVPDEDFWLGIPGQAVKVQTLDLIAPWVDDDFATLQDEDHAVFWLPFPIVGLPTWQAVQPPWVIGGSEDVPTLTAPPLFEQEEWRNWTPPVPAQNYLSLPYLPDLEPFAPRPAFTGKLIIIINE